MLSLYNEYLDERNIIVLNNINIYVNPSIVEAIQIKNCLVKYLPSYSFDFNSIKLTFNVLKIWMRRHFEAFRPVFQDDFEGFLRYAIDVNDCDRFAMKHFRHNIAEYIFKDEIKAFERDIDQMKL